MIILNEWFGRLGNNIIQLKNILHIAVYYNYNINILKHPFFNTTYLNNIKLENNNITKTNIIITDPYHFFYKNRIQNIPLEVFDINNDKIIDNY